MSDTNFPNIGQTSERSYHSKTNLYYQSSSTHGSKEFSKYEVLKKKEVNLQDQGRRVKNIDTHQSLVILT